MRISAVSLAASLLMMLGSIASAQSTAPAMPGKVQTSPIPDDYLDPETGRRVIHLSRFANDYSGVIYFTNNTFSPDSHFALIARQFQNKWRYLYTFDFDQMSVTPLVMDRLTTGQDVHLKSGNVYYLADHAAWVVPVGGGAPRRIAEIPGNLFRSDGTTVNADESLLLTTGDDPVQPASDPNATDKKPRVRRVIYTINVRTGEIKLIHQGYDAFGHVQFSPTDPDLCMFCHEGNWESVDRIWFINPSKSTTDASGNIKSNARIAFKRSEPREIAGHEFWQPDGKQIWFQHTFRARQGNPGFLTRMNVGTGKTTDFTTPRGFGGIHETFSPDGTFMIADGGGPKGDTQPGTDKYLSKLTLPTDGSTTLIGEHLASLAANDYAVEPNPHVSPDNRWVIFTATLHGTAQAYAVELTPKK